MSNKKIRIAFMNRDALHYIVMHIPGVVDKPL